MNADQQLLYEARVRNRQAVVAVVAGVLLIVASSISLSGPHTSVSELTLDLLTANKRFPLDLIAAVINGAASLVIAWTLVFLYQCARARNAEIRGFIKTLVLVAGVLSAVAGVAYAIIVAIKVHEFATTGQQTYDEATHLTSGGGLLLLQLVGQLAALLLAVSFVLVSLQAMRVGLLPRWMGYLGMFAGALVLFQIFQVPVVQLFWLAGVGYLISGRWPSGLPAAWRTGRAEAWPSSADMRAQRAAAGGGGARGGGARAASGARAPAARPTASGGGLLGLLTGRSRQPPPAPVKGNGAGPEDAGDVAGVPNPRSGSSSSARKRKRKHRR
jgi:hypothetical protein